jgi:hypothetical protein
MTTKSAGMNQQLIEGWLRDIGCTPEPQTLARMNWALKVNFPPDGAATLSLTVGNPIQIPRGVFIACHITPSPEHVDAFNRQEPKVRREFWQLLRNTLNRETIEFQIEGIPTQECPKSFQVSATRFDDGLTLDSFARSMSSVLKGCIDGVSCFQDRLGDPVPAAANQFASNRAGTQ